MNETPARSHRRTNGPLEILRQRLARTGSQRDLAKELGISQQYLCDVLGGKREPGPKVLKALGLVVRYVQAPRKAR